MALKRSDSLTKMREYIDVSLFRPKRKGELAIRRYKEEVELDHSFGRPVELKENEGDEFLRTFNELYQLGENVKDKTVQMKADKKNFNIPRTIAAAIEAVQNEEVQRRMSRKCDTQSTTELNSMYRQQSPLEHHQEDFLMTRKLLHKALLTTLEERKQARLVCAESNELALPIVEMVKSDAKKHARVSKTPPAWDYVVPYLWYET
eukprot:jgi/Hompol1/6086/HPOL_004840-RA